MVGKKGLRIYTNADGINAADIMHCAIDHLSASECLFESSPSHYDSAGYIAHIGIEMVLKSILMYRDGAFPALHSIRQLYDALLDKSYVSELPNELRQIVATLDDYESLRYPNLHNPIEIGTDDLLPIKKLANFLLGQLPEGLVSELERPSSQSNNELIVKAGRMLVRKKHDPA
ncbi:MAG: HEPN domain-containing protein [Pseudohongiella sp.]|nr:HEPN domain-containing protein [Pseudohongiella sp.]